MVAGKSAMAKLARETSEKDDTGLWNIPWGCSPV